MESQFGVIVVCCILCVSGVESVQRNHHRSESLRIRNSTEADPEKYQYVGLVFVDRADSCSGVLLSPAISIVGCFCLMLDPYSDWTYPQVLNAPDQVSMLIDCVDLKDPRGQMRVAQQLSVHRNCTKAGNKVTYNYGLIRFEEPFLKVFGFADTLGLPEFETPTQIDGMIQNEEPCEVLGWDPQIDETYSGRMQRIESKLRHLDWCTETIFNLTQANDFGPEEFSPDHQICVSPVSEGTSGCVGDNLGPLLCGAKKKVLVGIFSFVPFQDCSELSLPTVGSRLDLVSDWIKKYLDENRAIPTNAGPPATTFPNFNLLHVSALLLLNMYHA
ncbi:hypothetical protein GE061_003619 [Apolygus lucorum]|uniref:Uncharacterized protein n=1 Tax=Apolygus lucorum TaxID=248454 RepID=A0A6A4K672_APOLU|nr:hypothetical protein GE061_003619 [Apolygus lucorum]